MPGGVGYMHNWLVANGFSSNSAGIMQAIVMAESNGNPNAKNYNRDSSGRIISTDRGLFQINDKAHPNVSDACAYNPACAVKAALQISNNGTNFHPWATFNNKSYLKYLGKTMVMPTGAFGPAGGTGSASANIPPSVPSPLGSIGDALKAISSFFVMISSKAYWLRMGEILIGAVLVYMGLHSLTGMGPSPETMATTAATAIVK